MSMNNKPKFKVGESIPLGEVITLKHEYEGFMLKVWTLLQHEKHRNRTRV
jgi:hypothetical protein